VKIAHHGSALFFAPNPMLVSSVNEIGHVPFWYQKPPAWSLTDQLKFEYFTVRDFCVQVAAFRTRMSQTETRESENLEMKKKFLVFGSFGAMFLSVMLLFAPAKASVTSHCTNCTGIDSNGVTVTSTCRVRPIDSCFCPLTGKIIQNNCLRIP
jgi:hypothetical protein